MSDLERGNAAEVYPAAVRREEGQIGELINTLFVVITECEPDLDLARLPAKLPEVLATHGYSDCLCDVGSGQPDNRCTVSVYRDAYFVFAGLGVGTHVLETFDG